jgi:hypothetical protein
MVRHPPHIEDPAEIEILGQRGRAVNGEREQRDERDGSPANHHMRSSRQLERGDLSAARPLVGVNAGEHKPLPGRAVEKRQQGEVSRCP